MDIIFDAGNAWWKWFNPRTNQYGDCRHALVELSETDWQTVVGRSRVLPQGFARVNGTPYAYGDAARRYIIPQRPRGAARYHRGYYGVAAAIALSEVLERDARSVVLWASHAPIDSQYARYIVESAKGKWRVQLGDLERDFNVKEVMTFDEPIGGYSHYVFTEKGEERKRNPLANITTLVIDVGGYTADVVAVDPGGSIDLMSPKSTRTGVIQLIEQFEQALRANNSTRFRTTGDIDIRRIESAILTGKFRFGKQIIECQAEATASLNTLVNDIVQVITAAGGEANFDAMLLTGGGSAMIHDTLIQALPTVEFLLAEPKRELMKFANVFGGAKLAMMLRNEGAI
jgi:hypothetical protein